MNRLNNLVVMVLLATLTACGGGGKSSSSNNSGGGGGGGTVSGPPLSITTTTLPDGISGKAYSVQLNATGGVTPYTWTLVTSLPPGLTLNSSGLISGTLQNWGGDVTVVAQDSGVPRQSVTQKLTINLYSPLSIYTSSVPDGHTNIPYDFVVQSFDVKTWTITSGQLPGGLQLVSPSRTQVEIKGTPNQTGSFSFTLEAQSVSNPPQVVSKTYTVVIDDNPAILTSQVLDVVRNKPYQDQLSAVNGTPPYQWSALSTLPAGIVLDTNTGGLSGTFTNSVYPSFYNIIFQVADSSSPAKSGTRIIPINVVEQLATGGGLGLGQYATLNQSFYGYNNPFGGRQPFTWSVVGGTLPPGLVLSQSGQVNGTPTQLGDFTFTLRVTDSTNPPQTADGDYKISVRPSALTTSYSLPTRLPQGVPFSGFVAAQGGTPPYTWQMDVGSLPAGLQLNSSTGEVSGTPTTVGSNNFSVKVTDSGSPPQTSGQGFFIAVAPALGRNNSVQKATPITASRISASISPYSDPLDTANPDVDYYKLIVNNGTIVEIQVFAKQSNPDNPLDTVLEVVDVNGARLNNCSAGPSGAGLAYISPCLNDDIQDGIVQDSRIWLKMPGVSSTQSTVYVKVSDWRGDARPDMFYALDISGAVYMLEIGSKLPTAITRDKAFSQQLISTGGSGTPAWAVSSGNLPPGLTLSTTGLLSGAPTTSGTYNFTITATDAGSPAQTASVQSTVLVADPVKITSSPVLPDACLGQPYSFTMQYTGGLPPIQWTGYFDWGLFGISFDQKTATFSGVPNQTGYHTMNIGAYDTIFSQDYQQLQFTVKTCN